MSPVAVKVADGAHLISRCHIPQCYWQYQGSTFCTRFRFLSLGHYDGILGLGWLASLGPMGVDWGARWITVQHQGDQVTFWSSRAPEVSYSVVEVCSAELTPDPVPVEIQVILDQYASVFVVPIVCLPTDSMITLFLCFPVLSLSDPTDFHQS
jgi:hypothetical protein